MGTGTDLSLLVLQAAARVRLAQVSTGTPSVWRSSWILAVLITPMPAIRKRPVGPLRLSTQPCMGSRQVLTTMLGRTMHTGRWPHSDTISSSAMAWAMRWIRVNQF